METAKQKSNSKVKALLVIIGTIAICIFICSIIFHLTPLGMISYVADFAEHHYFLIAFICIVVALSCVKIYITLEDKIDEKYTNKINKKNK